MIPLTVSLKLDEKRQEMGKRRYQKGTIEFNQKKGEWTGRYLEDRRQPDNTFKRIHKRVFLGTIEEIPSRMEAHAKLSQFLMPINSRLGTAEKKLEISPVVINLGEKGAIGELIVSTDLLHRGFEVFRNLSPTGSADLIALKDRRTYTIQVKRRLTEKPNQLVSFLRPLGEEYDVLAMVDAAGNSKYYSKQSEFGILEMLPQICPVKRKKNTNHNTDNALAIGASYDGGSHPRTPQE